jgi:hypothetical protein
MKTTILLVLLFFFTGTGNAQTEEGGVKYFAQCMVNIMDEEMFRSIEANIRLNPNVEVVRLDWETKRAFVLTKNLTSFTDADFEAWFGSNTINISCVQTGVYGVDEIARYPFTNCSN